MIQSAANRDSTGQRGAVLLVVLWIVVAIGMLGMSFSASIRTEVDAARNVVDQKQAYYLARAGIEHAVFKLLEARSAFAQGQQLQEGNLDQIPPVLTGSSSLELSNGSVEVEVIDETGKINLNAPPEDGTLFDLIYNLLIMIGVPPDQSDVITDSIKDWRDQDSFSSPNGAETDYYASLDPPYISKDRFLDVPEELLLVRGVTPEIYYGRKGRTEDGQRVEFYGMQKYFTTFTRSSSINVNSAPLAVLAALPYLDQTMAEQIYAIRQEGLITDAAQLMERIPGLPTEAAQILTPTLNNNVYTLISTGKVPGTNVTARIRCVVELNNLPPKGYAVRYWNEADSEF